MTTPAFHDAARDLWLNGARDGVPGCRRVPEETPIALSFEGATYAVMMATPTHLDDFAVGFSQNEGIVRRREEIELVETVFVEGGVVLRIKLADRSADAFWERRRYMAGPSGCGLCGIESLNEAIRQPVRVGPGICLRRPQIFEAMTTLPALQVMNQLTGALHAAAFWTPRDGIVLVREDVGRHNALDKLAGAAVRAGYGGRDGGVLLTSRVSVEMVQKTAAFGASVIVAVSAPTALAIRAASVAGITLIAVARRDSFETFSCPERIVGTDPSGEGHA